MNCTALRADVGIGPYDGQERVAWAIGPYDGQERVAWAIGPYGSNQLPYKLKFFACGERQR